MKLDIAVIIIYMLAINLIGLRSSKVASVKDYFLGGKSIPWPVACFSIIATETSTLTFISIPGLAYITNLGFLQIAAGYIMGRILVSFLFLPGYFSGDIETTYQFLQKNFSISSKKIISVIFHITRLLADSVRLFATAIPLSLLLGFESYWPSILIIGAATFIYTYYGGLRSIVIVDSIQLGLYIFCAIIGFFIISDILSLPVYDIYKLIPVKNLSVISSGLGNGLAGIFESYNIFSGIIGGALLSFASHGTDHLMVQRVLSCKDLKSAKKAIIWSGVGVFFQFTLFLFLGLFILVLMDGKNFEMPDKIMPFFIVNYLPSGVRGLMLAGIFAAAMSTLSSSINSLSSSTTIDILEITKRKYPESKKLKISRLISLIWTLVIMGISVLLQDNKSPLVELGLGIASITYGGMLSIFLQGSLFKKFDDKAAISGVILSIVTILAVLLLGKLGVIKIFWPWFVPIGFTVSFMSGLLLNKIRSK